MKVTFQLNYFCSEKWISLSLLHIKNKFIDRKPKGAKTVLTHYLIKEEMTKNASRFSEGRRVIKARYAFSFSSKDGKNRKWNW